MAGCVAPSLQPPGGHPARPQGPTIRPQGPSPKPAGRGFVGCVDWAILVPFPDLNAFPGGYCSAMRILFLTHYFPPEVNAPASRTFDHCLRWVRAGHEVTVLTCAPNCPSGIVYPGYRNAWRQTETVEGIRVVRVWTYLAPNAGFVRRVLNYLSYLASALLASIRLPRPDVVVATSPQFFCGWAGVLVASLKRAPFVLEIRDIWPESIAAVGLLRRGRLLRLLERLERSMYRAADRIVAVGDGYRDKILEKVPLADRVSVITNGVDLGHFTPQPPDPQWLAQWGLEGKFVCSYIGTLGMAHGLEVVIEAARILQAQGRNDIRFCLVGDGAMRARLRQQAVEAGVDGLVVFPGQQPKQRVPAILASSGACLIHLKKCDLFETVVPSKVFEAMAMQRPIVMGVRGPASRIVNECEAGLEMEPGNAQSLASAVLRLADKPALGAALGRKARRHVETRFNRDVLASRFLDLFQSLVAPPAVPLPEGRRRAA